MITREHTKGDAPSVAVYSDCERYRYALTRVWDGTGQKVSFVMLIGGFLLLFFGVRQGDFEHGERLSLLPLSEDEIIDPVIHPSNTLPRSERS